MALKETIKNLQEQEISEGLRFLRHCRRFCSHISLKTINQKNIRLSYLYGVGTEEAMKEARRIQGDMVEAAARLHLYQDILEKAEKAERQQKGSGERFACENLPRWKKLILEIHRECEEIRQMPFEVKEGS